MGNLSEVPKQRGAPGALVRAALLCGSGLWDAAGTALAGGSDRDRCGGFVSVAGPISALAEAVVSRGRRSALRVLGHGAQLRDRDAPVVLHGRQLWLTLRARPGVRVIRVLAIEHQRLLPPGRHRDL